MMHVSLHDDVTAARQRLAGHAHVTPIMTSRVLNERVGASVYLKCENFQRMGAFKFRGAYNAISQLSDAQKARGVIAYSSGNHAQAVALVGKLLGTSVTIVMPDNAPAIKRKATEEYGATVVTYDVERETREALAASIAPSAGSDLVLIDNPTQNPIIGRFLGLPEATVINIGGVDTLISYAGGDGNDVVLSAVGPSWSRGMSSALEAAPRKRPVPAAHLSFIQKSRISPTGETLIAFVSCPPMSTTVRVPGNIWTAPRPWQLISVTCVLPNVTL